MSHEKNQVNPFVAYSWIILIIHWRIYSNLICIKSLMICGAAKPRAFAIAAGYVQNMFR